MFCEEVCEMRIRLMAHKFSLGGEYRALSRPKVLNRQ